MCKIPCEKWMQNFVYLDKTGKQCDRDIHWKGFLDQIKESEITFAQAQRISGCEDIKELEQRLQLLLEENPFVDAIVARYDNLAAVALSVQEEPVEKSRMI